MLARVAAMRDEFLEQETASGHVEHPQAGLGRRFRVIDDGEVTEAVQQALPACAVGSAGGELEHMGTGGRGGLGKLSDEVPIGMGLYGNHHTGQRGQPPPSSHASTLRAMNAGRPQAT